jgi:hypothetical protein
MVCSSCHIQQSDEKKKGQCALLNNNNKNNRNNIDKMASKNNKMNSIDFHTSGDKKVVGQQV